MPVPPLKAQADRFLQFQKGRFLCILEVRMITQWRPVGVVFPENQHFGCEDTIFKKPENLAASVRPHGFFFAIVIIFFHAVRERCQGGTGSIGRYQFSMISANFQDRIGGLNE